MTAVDLLDSTLERYIGGQEPERRERRGKPRVEEPFQATMYGVDSAGLPFNADCVLDNLSCWGLYLRILQPMSCGSEVQLLVQISKGAALALKGRVLRDEPQPDSKHGLAIAIDGYDFL